MEFVTPLCGIVPCLWGCFNNNAAYISRLEDNLNSLRNAKDSLDNLSQDVRNNVRDAQQQHRRLRNQVTGWLHRVEALEQRVNPILAMGTREVENKCVGSCCPKNCWSSYRLGKKVARMIPKVEGLTAKGRFDDVADDILVAAPMVEMPMEGPVVGFESKFKEVWQSVQDERSSVIGLVGIGGVGKTTLLKMLNNEFLKSSHGFDLVIYVVISKPADLGKIQNTVRTKLNISGRLWDNSNDEDRAKLIFEELRQKKFVLLLDDLWEKLELLKVGIPIPGMNNTSRVVITTRSEEVCRFLDAHKIIKVGCLPPHKALDLFISKVGEEVLESHPGIKELVKDVASECGGLPLALITIGRAMRGKTDARQWTDAKTTLMTYPSVFPCVKGEIFAKLVFSYDSLPSPTMQKCFEYCSIFPEDQEIQKEELIRLWIAEGIIDNAHIEGRQIVESLMQACLLESCRWEWRVKMHDMIRDMALWLACECGEMKNKFLVEVTNGGYHGVPSKAQLKNAEKVSLWGYGTSMKSVARLSSCYNIVTLIIRSTTLKVLPAEIFRSMNVLKVMDLSRNSVLTEIPAEIGCLINLEYLSIAQTPVGKLPGEVELLEKLRFLLVNSTTLIPHGVISRLRLLQLFEQCCTLSEDVDDEAALRLREMGKEMLRELEELENIEDISLVIRDAASIVVLLDSPKLRSCTRELHLRHCESLPTVLHLCTDGTSMGRLERLFLVYCDMSAIKLGSSSSSFGHLRYVTISNCSKVSNVSSLIYIPYLCTLYVSYCDSMEELIGEDDVKKMGESSSSLFSSLTSLIILVLPKLWRICPHSALPFPSLKVLDIFGCPDLKKLPFDSNTAMRTPPEFKIYGERDWWDNILQWDTQGTKDAFTSKFQPRPQVWNSKITRSNNHGVFEPNMEHCSMLAGMV